MVNTAMMLLTARKMHCLHDTPPHRLTWVIFTKPPDTTPITADTCTVHFLANMRHFRRSYCLPY